MKKLLTTLSFGLLAAPFASAQMNAGYLDTFIVQVKPDRRADFDSASKKIAEANRKAKGDNFIAYEQLYGEDNTVMFVSRRQNYADIEKASAAFGSAITEFYGPGGVKKMMADFDSTLLSARAELRRRHMELSVNAPKDEAAYSQMVGSARYLMLTTMRVRPGHDDQFREIGSQAKAAIEKGEPQFTIFISEAEAGQPSNLWYRSVLLHSLADLDAAPDMSKLMGEEQFAAWLKLNGAALEPEQTAIFRVLPELSNPPKDVAAVAPEFWHPKAASMSKPKPKPAETTKSGTQ